MRFFATSIPKAGTHLLSAIFLGLGFKLISCRKWGEVEGLPEEAKAGGDVCAYGHWRAHEPYVSEVRENRLTPIVLIRDPRDICLSMADFLKRGRPVHVAKLYPELREMPLRELIMCTIRGLTLPKHKIRSIDVTCDGWLQWREQGGFVLRYEELAESARDRIPIASVASIGLDPELFLAETVHAYGAASPTLNQARVGRWREEFDDEIIDCWRQYAGDIVTRFGYPDDPVAESAI